MNVWELMVIGVVALIVIGPQQLPKVIFTLGKLLQQCRAFSSEIKNELEQQSKQQELENNHARAEAADKTYHQDNNNQEKSL